MSIREQYKILEFGDLGDERGKLVVVEGQDTIADTTALLLKALEA